MSSSLPLVRMPRRTSMAAGRPGVECEGSGAGRPPSRFSSVWYALSNGGDGPRCSTTGPFTANPQDVCCVTGTYPAGGGTNYPAGGQISSSSVMGPSLTEETSMRAPNTPVATVAPRRRSSSTTSATSGSATSPGAASVQEGRRPFLVSP